MLRSQNIPARIVIGFKGGRWNSYGKFFQVEQLNAHSWVEVYLRPKQVPEKYLRPSMQLHGAWLRLDPTPGLGGTSGQVTEFTMLDRARELGDYSQYLWGHYVVGLDSRRQKELIYEPLASLTDKVSYFFSKQMWLETVPAFLASLTKASTWAAFLDRLLTLRGLLLTLLTLLLAYLVRRGLRRWSPGWVRGLRLRRRLQRHRGATEADTGRSYPTVEFYQRFEKLLARHGLARSENQTQHEFAVTVGGEFRSRAALSTVATVPKHLSDLFYEVRFGGHTLDKQQTDAVEQSLGQLATALASDDADHDRAQN